MKQNWKNQWDQRYSAEEYIYGTEPNLFFKEKIDGMKPGKVLLPADGEGRNGIYAAEKGWDVSIFDISQEGKKKALQLAEERNVQINYIVSDLQESIYAQEEFDLIVLIYAHFPPEIRSSYHRILNEKLRPGGKIIFEGFNKKHLKYREKNPAVGGPPSLPVLFSMEEILSDFSNYDFDGLGEYEIDLNEGLGHVGTGSVIRFVATKK